VQRPFDEIEDGFGLRQLRQGCYCRMWDDMAKDIKLRQQMPLVAAHTPRHGVRAPLPAGKNPAQRRWVRRA
jgi:hypothetical protein